MSTLAELAGLGQTMVSPVAIKWWETSGHMTAPTQEIKWQEHGASPAQHEIKWQERIGRMRAMIRGFGQDEGYATSRIEAGMTPGVYKVTTPGVSVHALPDASSKVIGTLQKGDSVQVFGELETDTAHTIDQNNMAIPNPDPEQWAGIDYVHVGTKFGAGWVAGDFLSGPIEGAPAPKLNLPAPEPSVPPAPKKDLVQTVVVGGLIGVAVLGAGALIYHFATHPTRRHAYA